MAAPLMRPGAESGERGAGTAARRAGGAAHTWRGRSAFVSGRRAPARPRGSEGSGRPGRGAFSAASAGASGPGRGEKEPRSLPRLRPCPRAAIRVAAGAARAAGPPPHRRGGTRPARACPSVRNHKSRRNVNSTRGTSIGPPSSLKSLSDFAIRRNPPGLSARFADFCTARSCGSPRPGRWPSPALPPGAEVRTWPRHCVPREPQLCSRPAGALLSKQDIPISLRWFSPKRV